MRKPTRIPLSAEATKEKLRKISELELAADALAKDIMTIVKTIASALGEKP